MTEPNDPARILRIIFDNAITHRRSLIQNLNKLIAAQAKAAMGVEQAANDADLQRKPFHPEMSAFRSITHEIELTVARIVAVDVQIKNISGLAKTDEYKFFEHETNRGKPANVTSIVERAKSATPQKTGSTTKASTTVVRENPGLQRQRERKQSQNNK